MMQGPGGGGYGGGFDRLAGLEQAVHQLRSELNGAAGGLRRMVDARLIAADKKLSDLAAIAAVLSARGTAIERQGRIVRIEDIPGRRVPFVLVIDIPIPSDLTTTVEASVTISQEGPFVAVKRMATFMSALEFQTTLDDTTANFVGRSFGRYRPIHSAWDVNDAQIGNVMTTANPFAAVAAVAVGTVGLTHSTSAFRTMEWDGRLEVRNEGSSFPRQNITVPSSMWTPQINAPTELGCLDFFERGEVLTVKATPNHVNNPAAGNADGLNIFGTAGWPFVEGQYDPHEGIVTPAAFTTNPLVRITDDNVTRLPEGLLTIAWEGYRIIQPVGPIG